MKHRICSINNGLGGSSRELMDGKSTGREEIDAIINKAAKDAYEQFFTKFGYCDAGHSEMAVRFGIEPAYMYEDLKMLEITKDKARSLFITGHSWGMYGTGIVKKEKMYSEYKKKGKFVKFVDKWHPLIFNEKI